MLTELFWADYKANSWKSAIRRAVIESLQTLDCQSLIRQRGTFRCVLVLLKPGKWVVVIVVFVLVDLPANTSILVEFRSGFPGERIAIKAFALTTCGMLVTGQENTGKH
jgi:hypothetical protein